MKINKFDSEEMQSMSATWSFKKHVTYSILIIGVVSILESVICSLDIETKLSITAKFVSLLNGQEVAQVGIISGADGPSSNSIFFCIHPFLRWVLFNIILLTILLGLYKPLKRLME